MKTIPCLFVSIVAFCLTFVPSSDASDLGRGRAGDVLHVHHPPDPVNVRTGNFYLPVGDLYLSCFGFPLEVYRSYNSVSTRNGPFGKGWTFNYDIQITVGEDGGMHVTEADGFVNEYLPVEAVAADRTEAIQKILGARKKQDEKFLKNPHGKGKAFYQEYVLRLREDSAFFEKQRDLYLPKFAKVSQSGRYVSRKRGTTHIRKLTSGYERETETGRTETYNARGLLTRISDRNDNFLSFSYTNLGQLTKVQDGCGQNLTIAYNPRGKIQSIRDSLSRTLTYQYDQDDRLTRSVALDGSVGAYHYDKLDRMVTLVFGDQNKTTIVYDPKTGHVTKQAGPGKKVTTYEYGKKDKARWAQVKDNQGLNHRYEYHDDGNKIVFVDSEGKKTITQLSVSCGKPVAITDEKGVGETFHYDDQGNLISKTDAHKYTTTYEYEPRFHLPSVIREQDGSTTRFIYDKKANLTYVATDRGKKGQHVKLTFEAHGKIQTMTNEKDEKVMFSYNATAKPVRIEKYEKARLFGSIQVVYDKTGQIEKVDYHPSNPETVENIKSTLAQFMRFLKPSGVDFDI